MSGSHTGSITKATDNERCDIHQLIKQVEFESVVKNQKISTYAKYNGEKTRKQYRLDNEMPVITPTLTYAKFRIQSDNITYGCVLIAVGTTYPLKRIREAFVQSVLQGVVVTLNSSDITPPPIRKHVKN